MGAWDEQAPRCSAVAGGAPVPIDDAGLFSSRGRGRSTCKHNDMSAHLNNGSIRVLVLDDHELFRIGLRQLLESEGFVVADAGSAEPALRRLPSLSPDVVVMGVNVPGGSELDATRLIRHAAPAAAVLMLPIVADDEHVLQAVKAGAVGYLLKESELGQIVAGIRAVAAGRSALSPQAGRALIDHIRSSADHEAIVPAPAPRLLSERERQVLSLLASGRDNAEIGEALFVSRSTVKNHVSRIFEKLAVDNRVRAAAYAIRNGLVEGDERSDSVRARACACEQLPHDVEPGPQTLRGILN
jgi:two-component system response regulator DevR